MAGSKPTLTEWRKLYQAASHVKEIAPWKWMTETDSLEYKIPKRES